MAFPGPNGRAAGASFPRLLLDRLALLLGILTLLAGCDASRTRPDIILITLDTTRADRLGCYGYPLASTPHLDAFATEAILLENAVTAIPITTPSHATMFTGLTPLRHGVHNNGTFYLDPHHLILAEQLAAQGYQTAAFVSAFVLHEQFGLARGFSVYDDDLIDERSAFETNARALPYLQQAGTDPLFLWVHYFDPHTPWEPPEPFASQTRGTVYDAEISAMDAAFGDLIAALRQAGRYEDAHIFVLGDHGEGLRDHGEREHGIFLYEETLRIPFLWKPPQSTGGRRDATLAGTVDLLPTVFELVGLPAPAQESVDGISLTGLLTGEKLPARDGLYAETLFPYYNFEWSPLFAWRTAQAKFIEAPRPELYELSRDPQERENRYAEDLERATRMAKRLRNYRLRHGQSATIPEEGSISPEVEERLRSLGYVWTAGSDRASALDSLPDPKDMIEVHFEYEQAKEAMDESRWDDAIASFEIVLAGAPRNSVAILGMGIALEEAGRPREALVHLERHLELKPRNAVAQERRGDALYQLGRWQEALEAYEAALGNQNAFLALARKRALTHIRMGRFDQARARLQEGKHRTPAEQQDLWDRWESATRTLADLGVERPAADEADWVHQVRAALSLGMQDLADHLLNSGELQFPTAAWRLRAEEAQMRGDWSEVARCVRRGIDLGDRSVQLYLTLVLAHLQLGDSEAAERAAVEGSQSTGDPGGSLHYNLACLLARRGAERQALDALEQALARGHRRADLLDQDADLEPLRAHPRFQALRATLPADSVTR